MFDCLQLRELNVTVLSDTSVADYKTADYLGGSSAPFLRSLHTSAFGDQPVCQSLEQPNIVTGLAAAGITVARLRDSDVSDLNCSYFFFSLILQTHKENLQTLHKKTATLFPQSWYCCANLAEKNPL